ncbi:MAG TPA: DUF881 domain-containing protein [Acidimicrobiales bacterium]|nr:DUF881 domain-containing protein [Acidimicrobiales bacterium]
MHRRIQPLVGVACALIGFLAMTAARSHPASPEARLPRQYRLAALIERQQKTAADLRNQVEHLRSQVAHASLGPDKAAAAGRAAALRSGRLAAGLVALRGPGMRVELADSTQANSPSGDINDLVIHSSDVQAAVNALWRSGAEAVSVNGERLVGTSAVLCVGNTLLLNGTVHSPPYVISALGADRNKFEADELVQRLHEDAKNFGLKFAVHSVDNVTIAPYDGSTTPKYARPS